MTYFKGFKGVKRGLLLREERIKKHFGGPERLMIR